MKNKIFIFSFSVFFFFLTGYFALAQNFSIPIISNPDQYKSGGATPIGEGTTTTENIVVFKATLTDPDNDQIKLEVELRQFQEPFTGVYDGGILTSDFIGSGEEVKITISGKLIDEKPFGGSDVIRMISQEK